MHINNDKIGLLRWGMSDEPGTALRIYRLDQFEKRADAADARMVRVEEKLNAIQATLAGVSTRDNIRNWGLLLVAVIIGTGATMMAVGVGEGSLLLQASANQLTAFQSGLSAVQAVVAANQPASSAPVPKAAPPQAPVPPK
jgi:hypothetical protein